MWRMISVALFLLGSFHAASASHYLTGDVTLNGTPYTGSTAYVNMWCSGSNWSGCSDWTTVNSHGSYTFEGANNSYGCCSATYSGKTWDKCQIYAYQWEKADVGNSEYSNVSFDCSATTVKNLALRPKDKKINVTCTNGGEATTGVSVSCYETGGSYSSSWIDNCLNGSCEVPAFGGATYTCSCSCRWSTWGSDCPYGGYPQKSVTVGANDSSASVTLDFTPKNKKIHVCVYAGENQVTKDIMVSCNSQGSGSYVYGSSSTADSDGCYTIKATKGSFYCSSSCNIWPCDNYKGTPNASVTLADADVTKDVTLRYDVPDKKIRVTLKAGGSKITSGMTVSANKQGGDWSSAFSSAPTSDGYYEMTVGKGIYNITAYSTNYQDSEIAGTPAGKATFTDSDPAGTVAKVTLTFLKNDATVAGTVSDGSGYISNVWMNVNAHDVKSQSGSATSHLVIKDAEVTDGTASTTQVYASCQTSSSGVCSVRVPAGTYSVCVWPPWDRQDLAQTCQEVTATANGLSTVNLVMEKKTGRISGCVTDSSGKGVKAYVNCWSYVGSSYSSDYLWRETDSSGCYSGNLVEGRTYTCTASPNTGYNQSDTFCGYTNEGQQTVTATSSTETVNFTVPSCNCNLGVSVVDAEEKIVPVNGSVECKPKNFKSGEYYYGVWGQMISGTVTVKAEKDRELTCKSWFWDSSYATGDDETTCTCSEGGSSCLISTAPVIDDAICGSYVDGEGRSVELTNISYISVYAAKGNNYKYCDATPSGYCCDVSEGTWQLGYWVDPGSGFSSGSNTTNSVIVPAGGGVDYDLTLLNTCSLDVNVLNLDSSGRPNAWVECCPYSASQEGANSYQHYYSCGGGESDSSGRVTIKAGCPAGSEGITYYCNAHLPYGMRSDEGLNNPEECSVQAIMGQVNPCVLQYEQPDGHLNIVVTNGDVAASDVSGLAVASGSVGAAPPLKGVLNALETDASNPYALATVDCFSPAGGSFQTVTDGSGNAACSCSSDDKWFVVAYKMVGTALYVSEATECACSTEGTSCEVSVDFVTTIPDAQSTTINDAATDQMSITLSDGAQFSCPPGCLGDVGDVVTCSVAPAVTPFTPNKVPVNFYGYFISCYETVSDANGSSTRNAIQKLNSSAMIRTPCNPSQLERMGVTENDIQCSYWDTAVDFYKTVTDASIDCEEGISFSVDHLTDFVVVGNGYLGGIQGEDEGAIGKEEETPGSGANRGADLGSCGGCYILSSTDEKLDDRILWGLILAAIGLSRIRRLRSLPQKKK